MKKIRKSLKVVLPLMAVIMIAGLILSRVYSPSGSPATAEPEERISSSDAADYIGRTVEVCGDVASADHIPSIGGEPTFINFGRPHPDQEFTAVIWGRNRGNWSTPPEQLYQNRRVCVTGEVEMHEGTPQIEASHPDQFRIP